VKCAQHRPWRVASLPETAARFLKRSDDIEPELQTLACDTDGCVMWNTVIGTRNGRRVKIDYCLWDEADAKNGISAKAQEAGFTANKAALMIGIARITIKGILPLKNGIKEELYKAFINKKRGLSGLWNEQRLLISVMANLRLIQKARQ